MFKGISLVLLGAASFGILSTFVKLAYAEGYTLGDVTGSQAFFGAILLWILYSISWRKQKDLPKTRVKTHWLKLVGAGTFTGMVSLAYYQCVKLVPASVAIILLMQFLWISILLELFIYKKKPGVKQLIAVLFILMGTVAASGWYESQTGSISITGILYGLLAALFYAVFLLFNGKLGNEYPVLQKSALMITGACLFIFIIFPPAFLINGALGGSLLKWGMILAIFGTVIPPMCFASGIPRAGLSLSTILSAVELPVAVSMSVFVLHEEVGITRWLGVALILGAIVYSNLENIKKQNIFKPRV